MEFTNEQIINELERIQREQFEELTEDEKVVLIETIEDLKNNQPFNKDNSIYLESIVEKSNAFANETSDIAADFLEAIYESNQDLEQEPNEEEIVEEQNDEIEIAKETLLAEIEELQRNLNKQSTAEIIMSEKLEELKEKINNSTLTEQDIIFLNNTFKEIMPRYISEEELEEELQKTTELVSIVVNIKNLGQENNSSKELSEEEKELIEALEELKTHLNIDPEQENYNKNEENVSKGIDDVIKRIKENETKDSDYTFLHNAIEEYMPRYISEERLEATLSSKHDLIETVKEQNKGNVQDNTQDNEVTEKREIEKIIEKIQENEAYQSKFLEDNKEKIIEEFRLSLETELEEYNNKEELTEQEQNKKRVLEASIKDLEPERNINTQTLDSLIMARGYNENNELYLRVIDKEIEELEKQLAEEPEAPTQETNPEESEERLEIKVDDENREEIVKHLNEILDEKAKEATDEEKQEIQNQKNRINNPTFKNENIEKLISENDLTQSVLESQLSEVDKEIEALIEEQENRTTETQTVGAAKLKEEYNQLKEKIEAVELNPEDMMYPEFGKDKERLAELEKEIENLPETKAARTKEEYNQLKEKIEAVELNPEDMMYPEFGKDKARLAELEKEIENLPETKAARIKEEYDKLKEKIEAVELNPEDMMYPEYSKDKARLAELEKEIENLPETKAARIKEEYDKLKEKIEAVELNPEDMMYPEFEKDKKRLAELEKELNNLDSIKISDKKENENKKKLDDLRKKKAKLEKEIEKLKKQKKEKEDNKDKKDKSDIQKKLDELKEKRERIAAIPGENRDLKAVKDAYNKIKKDAIDILGNSESFANATEEEKLDAISTGVETHERFKDLDLYKGDKEKLIKELKEDIAKGLGLGKGKEEPKEKQEQQKEKLWLKALSGTAGLGLGFETAMVVSGVPATIAVGVGFAAVKIYSNSIAPKVNAKIEKIQSAENYAKEHPIKNGILNGVKKINQFLTSGYGKWFVNGFGIGYAAGNIYKAFNKPTPDQGPKETKPKDPTPDPSKTPSKDPTPDPTPQPKPIDTSIDKGDRFILDKDLGGAIDEYGTKFGSLSDKHTNVVVDKIKGDWVHVSDAVKVDGKKDLVGWIKKEELIETLKEQTTQRIGRGR